MENENSKIIKCHVCKKEENNPNMIETLHIMHIGKIYTLNTKTRLLEEVKL